jgi:hypothetical protein
MGSTHADSDSSWRKPARLTVLVVLAAIPVIEGCSTQPSVQAASAEGCMASCNRASADGQACLAWSTFTPETCLRRFSVAQACCGPGDQPECALTTALAVGTPCVCRGGEQRATFVVQGSACKVP